jgi:3,4-dihydroxy 2-butanone 4-phosphate synthase/GTP cyclohydrolase II
MSTLATASSAPFTRWAEGNDVPFSSIDEILAEAASGRAVIMLDAADRENQGDMIIPAQFADAAAINFMATHARGLVCLAITSGKARELRLAMQPGVIGVDRLRSAFTVSIEARTGVETGISAFDRARTIAVAVAPDGGSEDLVSPGHVFPLVAHDDGVLGRDGHTEAAVDIARLAGLSPAAVLCEILDDSGSVAGTESLIEFARREGIKIGRIEDLIAFRQREFRFSENQRVYSQSFWGAGADIDLDRFEGASRA